MAACMHVHGNAKFNPLWLQSIVKVNPFLIEINSERGS